MSDIFDDRENALENQLVRQETLRFEAIARRNKELGLWIAIMKGLKGEAAEKHAEDFVGAQVGKSDDQFLAAVRKELGEGAYEPSDHRLRKKMQEEMAAALASLKAGT